MHEMLFYVGDFSNGPGPGLWINPEHQEFFVLPFSSAKTYKTYKNKKGILLFYKLVLC